MQPCPQDQSRGPTEQSGRRASHGLREHSPKTRSPVEMIMWIDGHPDSYSLVFVCSLWGPWNPGVQVQKLVGNREIGVTPKDRIINEGPWAPGLTSHQLRQQAAHSSHSPFCPVSTSLPLHSNHHGQLLTGGDRSEI